ncbi:hypothetical protein A9Q83_13500 [Alphaproteobacteria bacterium 46_93_T64]|nr:hypothetical protein A9Q83_13500 [Alphaproteobacteria bacterium 46_93_T64]
MRNVLMFILVVAVLAGCVDKGTQSNGNVGNTRVDPVADEIYNELMGKILGQKLTTASNGTNAKVGLKVPYRDGLTMRYKAIAACLSWDANSKIVKRGYTQFFSSDDWGYAEVGAINGCEGKKNQKSLNCKCQTIDHNDVNVLKIPADYRRAYKKTSAATMSKKNVAALKSNEKRYYLDLAWEKLLDQRKVYSVMVKQVKRAGYVTSASLIGGKTCDAVFHFKPSGLGEWEVNCVDGTKAVGVMQTQGQDKGSKGNGFDTNGNKINFVMTPAPSASQR